MLEAVKQDGLALRYAAGTLKEDRGIVLEAVEQDGLALEYVAGTLQARQDKTDSALLID